MNFLDRNSIERIINDLDVEALSDLYLKSPDVHSFVIEDIEEQGRYILLHVNQRAQHSLTFIEQDGVKAATHYTNHNKEKSVGEFLGHELHAILELFLGKHNNAPDHQRELLKKVAEDLLDGGPRYVGLCSLFEAVGAAATPPVTRNQLALSMLQSIAEEEEKSTAESDFSKRVRESGSIGAAETMPPCDEEVDLDFGEGAPQETCPSDDDDFATFNAAIRLGRKSAREALERDLEPARAIELTTTLLPTASKLANLIIADSIACVRCLDVRSEITNTIPSVTVAFHPDQTTAFIIIEYVGQVTVHVVDAVHYADGDRAASRWAPLYEMLSGMTATQEVTSAVREYIKCQVDLGTLKST